MNISEQNFDKLTSGKVFVRRGRSVSTELSGHNIL